MILCITSARQAVGLVGAEVGVSREDVVHSATGEQHAEWAVFGCFVGVEFHGRRWRHELIQVRRQRVDHAHVHHVAGADVQLASVIDKPGHGAVVHHEVAVLGRRLHAVGHNLVKARIAGQRNAPGEVVVESACASNVHDGQLVLILVHGALQQGLAQLVDVHGTADFIHHAAQVDWETGLVHAQAIFRQGNAFAATFGHFAAHDGDATHGVDEVEFHFIALALAQVHRLHEGHGLAGLVADGAGGFVNLRHLAGQVIDVALALLGADKHPDRLTYEFLAVISRHLGFGHVVASMRHDLRLR